MFILILKIKQNTVQNVVLLIYRCTYDLFQTLSSLDMSNIEIKHSYDNLIK